jgi:hypothetical protein
MEQEPFRDDSQRSSAEGPGARRPILAHAESILKLATVILGVFYAFGLLISNIQLMALGIADFSALQTRNIMVGFLFSLYMALWTLLFVPLGIALLVCSRLGRRETMSLANKVLRCIVSLLIAIAVVCILVLVIGNLVGLFYVGVGEPTVATGSWSGVVQFARAYGHPRIIAVSCIVIVLLILFAQITELLLLRDRQPIIRHLSRFPWLVRGIATDGAALMKRGRRSLIVQTMSYYAIFVPIILFDYSNEVYPNLKYNLGGGQPQLAELSIAGKKADVAAFSGTVLCCSNENQEQAIKADVVIWYQSNNFIYLSKISSVGPEASQVIAVDIKLVRTIRHLAKYVTVSSGGRIRSVHSL